MESGRGSDALAAARAAARARREAARELADQARDGSFTEPSDPRPDPPIAPERPPVFLDLPPATSPPPTSSPTGPPTTDDPARGRKRSRHLARRRASARAGREDARGRGEPELDPARPFDPRELRARRPEPPAAPPVDRVRDERFGEGVPRSAVSAPTRSGRGPGTTDDTGTPAWYPPLVGVWAATFVVVATLGQPTVRLIGAATLALALVGFFSVFRAPQRRPPTPGTATAYAVAVVVCAVAAWFTAREVHPAAGAALAALMMTGLVAAYEQRP